MHFITRVTYKPSTEINILDVFHTENLIIVPLTNTESQGFLVFTGNNESRELNSQETVSYTQLDVYKRQV